MVFEIDEQTKKHTEDLLKKMKKPVKLKVFVTKDHCLMCNETIQVVDLLAQMSPKIIVEKCACGKETEEAKKYGIDKHPAILIHGEDREYNVRYFGLPGGYEFGALVEDIVDTSTGDLGLTTDTIKKLEEIEIAGFEAKTLKYKMPALFLIMLIQVIPLPVVFAAYRDNLSTQNTLTYLLVIHFLQQVGICFQESICIMCFDLEHSFV